MSAPIERRDFLATLPAAAVALGCVDAGGPSARPGAPGREGGPSTLASTDRTHPPALAGFGVQLYTLRSIMAQDVEGTLATVAEMGYEEVEFAGLYELTPLAMRQRLDRVGLRAISSHHSLQDVRGAWPRVLEGAVTLGQSLVVVPGVPSSEWTGEGLRRVAADFNRAGEAARSAGLRFGYHNHDWEWRPLADGTVPMDLLLAETDASLVDWQMDVFWTVHGGGDPPRAIRAARGRVTSVHVKDRTDEGEMVDVGDGVIDFSSILNLGETFGLMHAFVEHDSPGDPLDSVRRSLAHLKLLRGVAPEAAR